MYTLGKLRHQLKTSSPSSECRRERERVLSASWGEEMYTLGKLRHQIKSFSPTNELRPVKDLLAVERVQARKSKSPPCFWGREDVTPGAM